MSLLLSFVNPLEFLLRPTVIVGIILAIIGTSLCFMAKRITMSKHNVDAVDKNDKLYVALMLIGVAFVLVGMIVIALPVNTTLYRG